jgi:hypothetical protein
MNKFCESGGSFGIIWGSTEHLKVCGGTDVVKYVGNF